MESIFEPETICKIEVVGNDSEFMAFFDKHPKGILCVPESLVGLSQYNVVMPETYRFTKWINKKRKDITINVAQSEGTKSLNSNDFWMPIVFLASDVSLPVFLNLVSSYIYDLMKGALKHDKANIHLKTFFRDDRAAVTKTLSYSGPAEKFLQIAKDGNLDKFIN